VPERRLQATGSVMYQMVTEKGRKADEVEGADRVPGDAPSIDEVVETSMNSPSRFTFLPSLPGFIQSPPRNGSHLIAGQRFGRLPTRREQR
jgi:hypothetical protein